MIRPDPRSKLEQLHALECQMLETGETDLMPEIRGLEAEIDALAADEAAQLTDGEP